ncbi:hypothetical protein QYF36_005037 [Acer negundo]|nr:hypothetical protein QYF36_005037 [Acer negundo]
MDENLDPTADIAATPDPSDSLKPLIQRFPTPEPRFVKRRWSPLISKELEGEVEHSFLSLAPCIRFFILQQEVVTEFVD